MNVHVIHNPAAGGRGHRRFRGVLAALDRAGCQVSLHATRGPGDAGRLARVAAAANPDRLAVAGGDGTVNEVVNGLAAVTAPPPLALIPMGTANVLAAEIGLALAPDAVARTIVRGAVREVQVGRAGGRRFLMMAGAGFDAHVVAGVTPALKKRIGKLAYVWSFLERLIDFPFADYRVTVDGVEHRAASVVVANGARYGGPFVLAPDARLETPGFAVCLFKRPGRLRAVTAGAALFLRRLEPGPHFAIVAGRRVAIRGPEGEPVQGDGDVLARLPVNIEPAPDPLLLVFPA